MDNDYTVFKKMFSSYKRYNLRWGQKNSLLNCAPCAPSHIRAISVIDTRFTRLHVHVLLPSSIAALRPFVLTCVVLLLLKGMICFVCTLKLTIHPLVSFFSFLVPYKVVLHAFSLSIVLSHWLHHYFYNYFATSDT